MPTVLIAGNLENETKLGIAQQVEKFAFTVDILYENDNETQAMNEPKKYETNEWKNGKPKRQKGLLG